MAEFTPQQKAIIASKARDNLVNAVWKSGKTSVIPMGFRVKITQFDGVLQHYLTDPNPSLTFSLIPIASTK